MTHRPCISWQFLKIKKINTITTISKLGPKTKSRWTRRHRLFVYQNLFSDALNSVLLVFVGIKVSELHLRLNAGEFDAFFQRHGMGSFQNSFSENWIKNQMNDRKQQEAYQLMWNNILRIKKYEISSILVILRNTIFCVHPIALIYIVFAAMENDLKMFRFPSILDVSVRPSL